MAEEITSNEEQQAAPETTQVAEKAEPELTLDDVYKDAGIPEAKPQQRAEPVAPVAPQAQEIPDPYDDKHKEWLLEQSKRVAALEASQQENAREKSEKQREIAAAKLEEEIQEATNYVKENAGLDDLPYDDKAKAALANFELNERARTDPKFKALWDNRNATAQNNAAFKKALTIVTKDIAKKYEVKPDPQLSANRRALKAAQQSSATTEGDREGADNPLGQLQGAAFEQAWQRMVNPTN